MYETRREAFLRLARGGMLRRYVLRKAYGSRSSSLRAGLVAQKSCRTSSEVRIAFRDASYRSESAFGRVTDEVKIVVDGGGG
jgi:hypothetical protein